MEVEIKFFPPLRRGVLFKRYKNSLAEIHCEDGQKLVAHCPNKGGLESCCETGRQVMLSYHPADSRRYPYIWEMIKMDQGWVGINAGIPNNLTAMAVKYGMIPELMNYSDIRRDVKYDDHNRIDLLLEGMPGRCFVEVINTTYVRGEIIYYPEVVSPKDTRRLEELTRLIQRGERVVVLFLVQRSDGIVFQTADHIDPAYAAALRRAQDAGVEVLAYRALVSPKGIKWGESIRKG